MNIKHAFFACLLILCAGAMPAYAAGEKMTGVFTDLHYDKKDGRLAGMELFMFPYGAGYLGLIQLTEGFRSNSLVEISANRNEVTFDLPESSAYGAAHFTGKIDDDQLNGQFSGGKLPAGTTKDVRLKRGKSYWQ